MLRSVALAFSIVANRLWVMVTFAIMTPEMFAGAEVDPVQLNQGVGVASWLSWLVNLMVVKSWLQRTRRPRQTALITQPAANVPERART